MKADLKRNMMQRHGLDSSDSVYEQVLCLQFHKLQGISGLTEKLLAFQQGCPDPMDGFCLYLAATVNISNSNLLV